MTQATESLHASSLLRQSPSLASDDGSGDNSVDNNENDDDLDQDIDDDLSGFTHRLISEPDWATPQPLQFALGRDNLVAEQFRNIFQYQEQDSSIYKRLPGVDDHDFAKQHGPYLRLFAIKPGTLEDEIHGDLLLRPVFDAPPYIALSYSWAQHLATSKVFIDRTHSELRISFHLWECLRRLRHKSRTTTVWVDAICINQQDLHEKVSQVQIMAQIYNQAASVNIWLGELDKNYKEEPDWGLFLALSQQPHPWWSRLWIVQECAYARECPVVMYSDLSVTLHELLQRCEAAEPPGGGQCAILAQIYEALRLPYDVWRAQIESNAHRRPLLQLLRETSGRRFSVAHDQVYALLSLIDEKEAQRIQPDYRKPYWKVKRQVEVILRESRDWRREDEELLMPVRTSHIVPEMLQSPMKDPMNELEVAATSGDVRHLARMVTCDNIGSTYANEAFHAAAYAGRISSIDFFLQKGIHINVSGRSFGSALQAAASGGRVQMVRYLLDRGADTAINGGRFGYALQAAVVSGNFEIVRMLLDHGAPVNAIGGWFVSAIEAAGLLQHFNMVDLLEAHGADALLS